MNLTDTVQAVNISLIIHFILQSSEFPPQPDAGLSCGMLVLEWVIRTSGAATRCGSAGLGPWPWAYRITSAV